MVRMHLFRSASHPLAAPEMANARRAIEHRVRQMVPAFADFCVAHLVARGGIRCVGSAHATRNGERLVRMLMRTYRIARTDRDSAVAYVVRTGRPLLRTAIQMDAATARRRDGRIAKLHRQLATRAALVVPIQLQGRVLGALSLCYAQSGRTYVRRDIAAAARIAAEIARTLAPTGSPHASFGLRSAARDARQGTTIRRRVAARN